MDKIVKAIQIEFENMDFVSILMKHIIRMSFDDISVSIDSLNCNTVTKHYSVDSVYLVISKHFRCDHKRHGKYHDIYEEFSKRIFRNDIAYLRIYYMDDSYEDYFVPWKDYENNEYKNQCQHVTLDDEGNYVVRIDKEHTE